MKKLVVLGMVLALMLAGSISAMAATFQLDGLYLLKGDTKFEGLDANLESKGTSFLVNAEAELFNNVVLEGRYLSATNKKDKDDTDLGEDVTQTLMLAGGKYRLLSDNGMSLYVGAGYGTVSYKDKNTENKAVDFSGSSIYGKAGIVFDVSDQIQVYGDFAYAPMVKNFKNDVEAGEGVEFKEAEGTFSSIRGGVVYFINDMIGVQGGFTTANFNAEKDSNEVKVNNTLYGAGVVVRF